MKVVHGEVEFRPRTVTRTILGVTCRFYPDGTHRVFGLDLNAQELHDSEVLRLARVSLMTGQPAGDKRRLWIDATAEPAEVWVYGERIHGTRGIRYAR